MDPKIIADNIAGIILTVLNLSVIATKMWIDWKKSKLEEKKAPLDRTNLAFEISEDAASIVKSYTSQLKEVDENYKKILVELKSANEKITKTDKILLEWGEGIKKLLNQLRKEQITPCWEPETYWGDKTIKPPKRETW